jgi:hypothetical protein
MSYYNLEYHDSSAAKKIEWLEQALDMFMRRGLDSVCSAKDFKEAGIKHKELENWWKERKAQEIRIMLDKNKAEAKEYVKNCK